MAPRVTGFARLTASTRKRRVDYKYGDARSRPWPSSCAPSHVLFDVFPVLSEYKPLARGREQRMSSSETAQQSPFFPQTPESSTDTFTAANGAPLPVNAQLAFSFSAISEQLLASSRALAHANRAGDPPESIAALAARLDALEAAQRALGEQLEAVRDGGVPSATPRSAPDAGPSTAELAQQLAELKETLQLRDAQLYAKLHNARATQPKQKVLAPPTRSGRPPANFPNTRGEFEHLTRERYEAILKAYDQPLRGDTAAKKEAARVFLGLPAEGN
ncbi:hypothetical protein K488DRAFT_88973 [Vararia minispora EC-137]|uniref:Uncharacterized protein n=1 Tax=Vararia minispora EC-137 TaxID=1314806 RepID=A0ACB8QC51_9AGAM|nr:hypothetical protein K488DRAFT_88973 [Vararia minispora EC-137]